ncbi:MAG: hypothetical protein LBV04_04570 [Deferribacteraceae bacterium]|jgi:hypothetical protein|nr:hypothetical protein [Deferribacteraceae bacterium]
MGSFFKALGKFFLFVTVGSVFIVASILKAIFMLPVTCFYAFKKPSGEPNAADIRWFWKVIAASNTDREVLYNILRPHNRHKILIFHYCFEHMVAALRQASLFDEQEADDICYWVVSQGEGAYKLILDNPEMLPRSVRGYSDKILYGVADRIFYKKYNKPIGYSGSKI